MKREIDARAELEVSIGRKLDEEHLEELRCIARATGLEARPAVAAAQLLEAFRMLRASPDSWARSVVESMVVPEAELELLASSRSRWSPGHGVASEIVASADRAPGVGGFLGTGRWATMRELGLLVLVVQGRKYTETELARAVDAAGQARRRHGQAKWEREVSGMEERWREVRAELLRQREELREVLRLIDGDDGIDALVHVFEELQRVDSLLVALPLDERGDHPARHT